MMGFKLAGVWAGKLSGRWFIRLTIILFAILFVTACSSSRTILKTVGLGVIAGSNNSMKKVSIESLANSNLKTPVAVDLLFINDKNIAPLLSALSGPEWFSRRQELIKRYDNEIQLVSLEIVPLSYIETIKLPKGHKEANNILLFANYRSSHGQYVAELSHFKSLKVRLLRNSYELLELGE